MKDGSSAVESIQDALDIWAEKLQTVQDLILQDPLDTATSSTVQAGASNIAIPISSFIQTLNQSLIGVGIALLVLMFYIGIFDTASSLAETKRPEFVFKLFVRVAVVGALVKGSYSLTRKILNIFQSIVSIVAGSDLDSMEKLTVPDQIVDAAANLSWFEKLGVSLISTLGSLAIIVAGFIIVLTVYGRIFKICMYMVISPIPIALLGSKKTAKYGEGFLKSFASVCIEAVIILLAIKIYYLICGSSISVPVFDEDASAQSMVWNYLATTVFNMLILVVIIKTATTISKEIIGG